ncbi:GNAT family N-acetyltransferase [Ideonella azotifigens]|nr:GNAT family N-acetyltransferase [Ideonella azotifigens]MCD2340418.1 GNAT family N-acetyltransferase [Ideonella azotifigens]
MASSSMPIQNLTSPSILPAPEMAPTTFSLHFTLRPARPGEAGALSALARASKAFWPYSTAQVAAWADDLRIDEATLATGCCWVAERVDHGTAELPDALIAGFVVLQPGSPDWALQHCWVLPEQIGRGVGRALLAQSARLAGEAGAAGLTIDADPHAEPFYLARGAQRVGSQAAPIEGEPDRVRPQLRLALAR